VSTEPGTAQTGCTGAKVAKTAVVGVTGRTDWAGPDFVVSGELGNTTDREKCVRAWPLRPDGTDAIVHLRAKVK
jgi:hypothetical protein